MSLSEGTHIKQLNTLRYVWSWRATLTAIHEFALSRLLYFTDVSLYYLCSGNWVLLKPERNKHLED